MNQIVNVLMNRDGMSVSEAKRKLSEVRMMVMGVIADGGDCAEVEEIMIDELGLEPDYIYDLL